MSAPIRTAPPVACSRAQARAASGGGGGASASRRSRTASSSAKRASQPGAASSRSSSSAASRPSTSPSADRERAAQRVERDAEQRAGGERRQVDLHAARAALEAGQRRAVVDGCDERAVPRAVDLERVAEVEDDADAVLRQLHAPDRRGGALLIARVAQDGPAERRVRRALVHASHHRRASKPAASTAAPAAPAASRARCFVAHQTGERAVAWSSNGPWAPRSPGSGENR